MLRARFGCQRLVSVCRALVKHRGWAELNNVEGVPGPWDCHYMQAWKMQASCSLGSRRRPDAVDVLALEPWMQSQRRGALRMRSRLANLAAE